MRIMKALSTENFCRCKRLGLHNGLVAGMITMIFMVGSLYADVTKQPIEIGKVQSVIEPR